MQSTAVSKDALAGRARVKLKLGGEKMEKKAVIMLVLAVLGSLLLGTTTWAGPFPPASKLGEESETEAEEAPAPVTAKWFLLNGAFDGQWDGDVPQFWKVYAGDADAYGKLDLLGLDATGGVVDQAFAFQIIDNEVTGDHNAYLYQEMVLSAGDYWVTAHSTIYAVDSTTDSSSGGGAYNFMTYYALVPTRNVVRAGAFTPDAVSDDDWKELWPHPTVCREDITGSRIVEGLAQCDYIKRAETVTVAGGTYFFILRAELKWPDWRAFAYYVFDDMQVISATPLQDNWNECASTFCLEGVIRR
jgi:hypothetical protein